MLLVRPKLEEDEMNVHSFYYHTFFEHHRTVIVFRLKSFLLSLFSRSKMLVLRKTLSLSFVRFRLFGIVEMDPETDVGVVSSVLLYLLGCDDGVNYFI